jgi:hypothetical protein
MATFIKIASATVGSGGASSINFNSIPGTYTDLVLKGSIRTNSAQTDNSMSLNLNGSGSGFSSRFVFGNGSSAASGTGALILQANGGTSTASTFSNFEIYLPNYTSSNNKSFSNDAVTENNATSAIAGLLAGLWSNTAAVTSLSVVASTGTFVQYSTATLYGISNS